MTKLTGRFIVVLVLGWNGAASALLIDNGQGLIYDDVLDITWLQDANYADTSGFHTGLLSWNEANFFIAELNNNSHLGVDTWRLPNMDVDSDGVMVTCSLATEIECRDNELGYMSVVYGVGPANLMDFVNVQYNYWSSTDYDVVNVTYPNGYPCTEGQEGLCAWRQGFGGVDSQNYVRKYFGENESRGYSAWAVVSGDIAAVPEPSTLGLLSVGLLGLGFMRRRRQAYLSVE